MNTAAPASSTAAPLGTVSSASPGGPAPRRGWRLSQLAVLCVLLYFGVLATEGVLRWALAIVRLEPLLYLRELLPLAALFLAGTMRDLPMRRFVVALLLFQFALAGLVGFHHTRSVAQVIFGLKVFLPLIVGVVVYPAIVRNWEFFWRGCAVLLGVAAFGVILNSVIAFPWIGGDFKVGNVTVEMSREWIEIDGRDRLPGFSRASFDAAAQIIVFAIITLCGVRGFWRRAFVGAVALYAVMLTTSKAPFASLVMILVNFLLLEAHPRLRVPPSGTMWAKVKLFAVFALRMQIIIYTLATIFFPLNAVNTLNYIERDLREDSSFHLLSMQDRVARFWPLAVEHIQRNGSRWLGTGAGGVGAPLDAFGNVEIPIACDNAFLYAYAVFGLLFIPYCLVFLWQVCTQRLMTRNTPACIALLALSTVHQALTENTFEGIVDCLVIGLIIAHLTYGWRMRNSPLGRSDLAAPDAQPA